MLKKKLSKKPNLVLNNSTKNYSIKSLIKDLPYQTKETFIKKIEISPSLESYSDIIKTSTLNNSIHHKKQIEFHYIPKIIIFQHQQKYLQKK